MSISKCRRCGGDVDATPCPAGGDHVAADKRQDPRRAMTVDAAALRERLIGGLYDQQVSVNHLCRRQRAAIDAAIDMVIDQLARAYQPATPGMGVRAWLHCDEVCDASRSIVRQWQATLIRRAAAAQSALRTFLARHPEPQGGVDVDERKRLRAAHDAAAAARNAVAGIAFPVPRDDSWPAPTDALAVRRCLGCLAAVPEARACLDELALRSPDWAAFVAALPTLEDAINVDAPNRDGALMFCLAKWQATEGTP